MKALVTGGAGFIGSHLCDALIDGGHEVVCYDNLLAGTLKNIQHLMSNKRFTFKLADVRDRDKLDQAMRGVDIVFNQMAAKKNICEKNPLTDCEINAGGTLNVLLSMVANGVKKIVHASTGSVYGEVPGVTTEFTPTNPVSYYGVSKLAGEKYVSAFGDLHGIEYMILRYFHVYGARQDSSSFGGVIPIFIRQAMDCDPLTIHDDGDQVRSFTYIDDVVKANLEAAVIMDNSIHNCASGVTVTINEMAAMIGDAFGGIEKVYCDRLLGDVRNFNINNALIKKDFKIKFTTFVEGLRETIGFYVQSRDD